MKNYVHKSTHFYGYPISDYGIKNGYIDYRALSRSFDAVLCNNVTNLFYATINGEYNEPEQVNGYIDYSDEINALQEQIDDLEMQQRDLDVCVNGDNERYNALQEQIDGLQEQIDDLEREQYYQPEIYQYFIISDRGAEILKDLTDEIVYYIPALDIYVWGVTHWGTSWDYVLTNIKIELSEEV